MQVKWQGVSELKDSLAKLSLDMQNKAGRAANNAAAQVVRREAKLNAQTRLNKVTGALLNNIVVKRYRSPRGQHWHVVMVRHGAQLYKKGTAQKIVRRGRFGSVKVQRINDPYYWKFLELGTKTKGGAQRIEPRRFIQDAIEAKQDAALKKMSDVLRKRIERANRIGR